MSRGNHLNTFKSLHIWIIALSVFAGSLASGRSSSGSIFVAWDPNPEPHVAGYKVHYGTTSGQYTTTLDVGMATEAELATLEPLRLHYCAVTAYDPNGLESEYSEELPIVYNSTDPAHNSPGGAIILINPALDSSGESEETSSILNVEFAAAEGEYYAWARIQYPSGALPAEASIDASPVGFFSLPGEAASIPSSSNPGWIWSRLVTATGEVESFQISSGSHTLDISSVTEGIEVDRIALTTSAFFVPTDAIPKTGDAVSIIRQPQALLEPLEGETLQLEVEVVATGTTQYQWFKDGYALLNENQPILSIGPIEPDQAGSYTALIQSGQASVATNQSVVIIVEGPFSVSNMTVGSENSIDFEIEGKVGALISVYASDNLTDWDLISVQYNESGTISIEDPEAEGETTRFYRLEAP